MPTASGKSFLFCWAWNDRHPIPQKADLHHGHPSTLHLRWARRLLAAAPAVLFAQSPTSMPTPNSPCSRRRQLSITALS
ncbi:DUF1156 domain-containing protein [Ectothiorhodospira sp. 9905]|uniref:DUF1156 domain-containing protein n=1 Tax=unclassified Ectothiorhodospira TaxID=2684909 RepID=UPI00351CE499